ncbi:MAG TPA: hypothetical protein PKN75_12635 [Bacteroidia bacterium]|nr:hypothetical protein [Bacteroidia bacterium]
MQLYTFILELKGGTYIKQVSAKNHLFARGKWLQDLEVKEIPGITLADKKKLLSYDFRDEDPIEIKGTKNVWHFLINVKSDVGFVNIIKTSEKL